MNKIPAGVHNHIFRFLTHPAADAIRERISEFQAFSSQHESTSHLNTFYIFFLLGQEDQRHDRDHRRHVRATGGARRGRRQLLPSEPLASL